METSIVRQYLGKDIQDLKKSKPSIQALEQARFFSHFLRQKSCYNRGESSIIRSGYNNQ